MTGLADLKQCAIKAAAIAATAAGFAVFDAAPAQAQLFGWWGHQPFAYRDVMTPGEIRRDLARQGYRMNGPLQRNGRVILADVVDGRGRQLRLIVDPVEGAILQRFVNVEPRPQRGAPGASRNPEFPDSPDAQNQPAPRAAKPAAKPKAAVRSLPQQPKIARERPESPETPPGRRANPQFERPQTERAQTERVQEPAIAATPAEAPRQATSAAERPNPPLAAPSPTRPADQPGFAKGVPINPLD